MWTLKDGASKHRQSKPLFVAETNQKLHFLAVIIKKYVLSSDGALQHYLSCETFKTAIEFNWSLRLDLKTDFRDEDICPKTETALKWVNAINFKTPVMPVQID